MKYDGSIQHIGILGSGGQADELESYLGSNMIVKFRALTSQFVDRMRPEQIDIMAPSEQQKRMPVIAAVGAPYVRRKLVNEWPGTEYEIVISKDSIINPTTKIGRGTIIAPGVITTTGVEIGDHSIINVGATISHNCSLGEYSTVGPGVHLAGNVMLGTGSFIGIGAVIKNGIRIASGVVVGAGAVVINDILEENAIYAGVPAKKIGQNSDWLSEVR